MLTKDDFRCNKLLVSAVLLSSLGSIAALGAEVEITGSLNPCPPVAEIVANLEKADAARRDSLDEVSALRHYTFWNERLKKNAEMLVRSVYHKGVGPTFEVVSSEDAEGMSGRVFRHVLDAEKEAAQTGRTRINSENYDFELLGMETLDGRPCYMLQLTPKQKSKYLLDGIAWIDAKDFAIARVSGRPSASVSFWVGRPTITMDFEKVGNYWLIARNRSHAQGRLAGVSELTIEYSDYQVNGTARQSATVAQGRVSHHSLRAE